MRSSTCHSDQVTHFARKMHFHRRVGERMRAAREKAGLSLTELGERIGMGASTINNAENGAPASVYMLALIAQELDGATLDDLVPLVEGP